MVDTVLIIEDDVRIANWVERYLQRAGFKTQVEHDGKEGLARIKQLNPSLIVLDLMLPSLSGMEICQQVRNQYDIPIIMLTAKDDVNDKISGLNQGADDYVTKPFEPDELVARVQSLLRRTQQRVQDLIQCAPFTLNLKEETAQLFDEAIDLHHTQFKILEVFVKHPNQVLSREQLIQMALGKDFDGFDRSVDNHISRLRKRVSSPGLQPIKTVYGAGYKFVPTTEQAAKIKQENDEG